MIESCTSCGHLKHFHFGTPIKGPCSKCMCPGYEGSLASRDEKTYMRAGTCIALLSGPHEKGVTRCMNKGSKLVYLQLPNGDWLRLRLCLSHLVDLPYEQTM